MKPSPKLGLANVLTSKKGSHFFWTAALIGIALLLLALALLQYRWNAQIRQAAEARVGADLESVMMKWHLDLYGELSTICIALQVGPDSGAHDAWNDYLRRYQKWRQGQSNSSASENIYSNPDVVSEIFIWETSRRKAPGLLRFNADAGKIEPVAEPPELKDLLVHLQERSSNLESALRAWASDEPAHDPNVENELQSSAVHRVRTNAITGWQFDESIPAIVHPIVKHGSTDASEADAVDWFVIVLNRASIEHRIFPELTSRYFGAAQGLEYKVAVVSLGETSHLLYSSDPEFGIGDLSQSDSVMNIFGPPPESTEGSFWQSIKNKESLRGEEWHSFSGPVWFPIVQHTSKGASWMLFLQHRTAPLEASINRVWRGNLILGGAILLLLTISMLLVMMASHRVRALAAMQMDFVASISHELRTPLTAMLAAGQNISDGFAPDLPKYGSSITTQARHLIDLVDQILLFAAMRDGKQKYVLEPISVEAILRKLQKTTFPVLEEAGFMLGIEIADRLPLALGDSQAIFRCIQNLLENAAKYSGNSRWIAIRVNLNESLKFGRELSISVADHGMGIEPAELERIFDPFYRGASVVAAQIRGSGLGLSVVKHIVTALGGRLDVTSKPGQGSVFTLYLRTAEHSNDLCERKMEAVVLR